MRELGPGEVAATMWWNPLTVERIRMRTRLSADDCAARMQAHIYSFWQGTDPVRPFVGRIRQHRFTLYRNPARVSLSGFPYHLRNNMLPVAYGTLTAVGPTETLVTIHLALNRYARIFWSVLLISCLVAFVLTVVGAAVGAAGWLTLPPGLVDVFGLLTLFLLACCCFWYVGYLLLFFLVRGQRVFLVDTLQRILDAWEPVFWEPVVP